MRVIGVNPCRSLMFCHVRHWCFIMPIIDFCHVRHWFIMPVTDFWHACPWCFCQACHQWTKYKCCLVTTKSCVATFASRLLRSTSLEGKNRYSTETCLLINSWRKNTLQWNHARVCCMPCMIFALIVITSNGSWGDENYRIMVSEADIKPFNEQTTPCRRRQVRTLGIGIGCSTCCELHCNCAAYTLTGKKPSRGVGNMWTWE